MAKQVSIDVLKEQLEEIFAKSDYDLLSFLLGDYDEDAAKAAGLEHREQDGGGEGGSEYCYTVFSIGDKYYKIAYSYYSHEGYETDYATAYEVTPVQRMTTYYE